MKNLRFVLSVGGLLLALGLVPVSASASALGEIGELLSSAAGRVLARQMGLTPELSELLISGQASIADAEAERWLRGLQDVRARYLRERPQDELIFDAAADEGEPFVLRGKQEELLTESLFLEASMNPEFVRVGQVLGDFRSQSAAFLAGGGAVGGPLDIAVTKTRARALFEVARAAFSSSFDAEKLADILEALRGGGFEQLTPEAKLELKVWRKDAAILRSAYAMLGESHEAPEAIRAFARDFGKLNDAIENELPELVAQCAGDLKGSLDAAKIGRALDRFSPAGRGSFDKYLAKLVSSIRDQVASKVLPVEEFHDLRKRLKEIMNLLYLSEKVSPAAANKAGYDFLYELNTELGLMHDELVSGSLRGELNYKKQKLEVPKKYRDAIMAFLDRL